MTSWFLDEQGAPRSGWRALAFYLLLMALVIPVAALWKRFTGQQGIGPWVATGVALLASNLCLRFEGRRFHSLGFRFGWRWLQECLAGTLGGILLILAMAAMVWGLDGLHFERQAGIGARQLLGSAWMLLGVAFNEELSCRGYPFQRVVAGSGPMVGQLVFAAIFAFGHWDNPGMVGDTRLWATLNIGLAALLLGFCYLRTGSLALSIGVHLGWNWAQGSLLGFGVSGTTDYPGLWKPVFHPQPDWLTGGAFGLEASLACTLVCGLAILGLWRWKGIEPTFDASTAWES
jgi:hypothetical protein